MSLHYLVKNKKVDVLYGPPCTKIYRRNCVI